MGTRDTILEAAASVVRTLGLGRATTKEIAKAAGYSEATLYKHFTDKEEIFVELLRASVPAFLPVLKSVQERAGQGTVRDNLLTVVRAAMGFYHDSLLMLASTFAEPKLLARHRETLAQKNLGPHRAIDGLAAYLTKEQQLGRVAADADARAVASMVLGGCFLHAFLDNFAGRDADPAETERYAVSTVDTALRALG